MVGDMLDPVARISILAAAAMFLFHDPLLQLLPPPARTEAQVYGN